MGVQNMIFSMTLNALVGVHERIENLLNHIGVRGSLFCDDIFMIKVYKNVYREIH